MDPLSIIASVTGISQAGVSLSKALYELISSMRGAPGEIADIALGLNDLSAILLELRHVLRDGKSLCRPKSLRTIRSAMRRIGKIHHAVGKLMDVGSGVGRLKWAFRRSTSTQLLHQIEANKSAINLVLHTMMLAVQIRIYSGLSEVKAAVASQPERELELDLTRRQAENMVGSSFQSLRRLTTVSTHSQQDIDSEDGHANPNDASNDTQNQLVLWTGGPDDTAAWLYRTVFSSYAESLEEMDGSDIKSDLPGDSDEEETRLPSPSLSLQLAGLSSALKKSNGSQNIVNELLAEWTDLTNEEIEGIDTISKTQEADSTAEPKVDEPLSVTDAVGRKFIFPFHKANTWEGLSKLMNEAFLFVDIIGPHVVEGHYSMISAESGCVILPSVWSDLVKPGEMFEMIMWPQEERPTAPLGTFPPGPRPEPSPPSPPPCVIPKLSPVEAPVKSKSPEPRPTPSKTMKKKKAAYVEDN